MPKGGARVNSGPPPDPDALRRDRPSDRDGWTDLPSEGRRGRVPSWPLPKATEEKATAYLVATGRDLDKRESVVWRQLWRTPQAVAWERLGWTLEVALYARLFVQAELGDMKAATEVRQMSNNLGLSPAAMLRNRWRIARNHLAERRSAAAAASERSSAPATSMRDRLKALDGEGA